MEERLVWGRHRVYEYIMEIELLISAVRSPEEVNKGCIKGCIKGAEIPCSFVSFCFHVFIEPSSLTCFKTRTGASTPMKRPFAAKCRRQRCAAAKEQRAAPAAAATTADTVGAPRLNCLHGLLLVLVGAGNSVKDVMASERMLERWNLKIMKIYEYCVRSSHK